MNARAAFLGEWGARWRSVLMATFWRALALSFGSMSEDEQFRELARVTGTMSGAELRRIARSFEEAGDCIHSGAEGGLDALVAWFVVRTGIICGTPAHCIDELHTIRLLVVHIAHCPRCGTRPPSYRS